MSSHNTVEASAKRATPPSFLQHFLTDARLVDPYREPLSLRLRAIPEHPPFNNAYDGAAKVFRDLFEDLL